MSARFFTYKNLSILLWRCPYAIYPTKLYKERKIEEEGGGGQQNEREEKRLEGEPEI